MGAQWNGTPFIYELQETCDQGWKYYTV